MNAGRTQIIDDRSPEGFTLVPPDEEEGAWTESTAIHLQYGGSHRYMAAGTGESTATWTFPSVRFLKPTGMDRPDPSWRWV